MNSHSYGRLIGDPEDRGPSAGATGTVNRHVAGSIVSYTAAPGDDTWTVGDRFCTNPLMIGRYNHIASDSGDHTLQPGETVVIRPDMSVEWRRAGAVVYDATKKGIAPVSMPTPSITSETTAARHSTLRW
ncbi:hypothetical protein [Microbacterium maritypicum]